MGAWDDIVAEDERSAVTVDEPDDDRDQEETPEESEDDLEDADEGDEGDEEEGGEAEPEEEGVEEAHEEEEVAAAYDDPEIQAYLAKYGGDQEKALKGAAELQRLMGRLGQEKSDASRRVEELERELEQARALGESGAVLSDEAREWVDTAIESANPGFYVQQAIEAGEFNLARAVCREWAQVDPYEALRAGQIVDAREGQLRQVQAQPEPIPPTITWEQLSEHYPELKTYEAQMVAPLGRH